MPREALQFAVLFAASLLALPAQQGFQSGPPQERLPAVRGIFIPPVPGLPFSATLVIEWERELPDGSTQVLRTINLIARDSRGRTRNEIRRLMPESFHGSPELTGVHLYDPETGIRTTLLPAQQTARREYIPKQPSAPNPPNSSAVKTEDLGTTTLNGLQAKGTRRIYTVSSAEIDDGEPFEVESETWYSTELQLNLLVRYADPRTGVQTAGVSGLKREEQPATLFEVPQDYKIVGVTPRPATLPATPGTQQGPPS